MNLSSDEKYNRAPKKKEFFLHAEMRMSTKIPRFRELDLQALNTLTFTILPKHHQTFQNTCQHFNQAEKEEVGEFKERHTRDIWNFRPMDS